MDLRALRYFSVVAEECNIGRAAARLHMTQPPLSRAMRQLEEDLGVALLERVRSGVTLTPAGVVLLREAVDLLARVDRIRADVRGEAGEPRLSVGSLADTMDLVGGRLVAAFRARHPHVAVTIHESDLSDPSAGLRSGTCDVALTRTPFAMGGLRTHVLARQAVGVVVRDDDPLAGQTTVRVDDLADRTWVRLPDTADPEWLGYWTGPPGDRETPELHTIQECLQSVLWNRATVLAPIDQVLPPGLVAVPVEDREPNELVLAWRSGESGPLIRAFVSVTVEAFEEALPG